MKKSEILMERINSRIEAMNTLEEDAYFSRLAKNQERSDSFLRQVTKERAIAEELIVCFNLMFKSNIRLEPLEVGKDSIMINWVILS